MTRPTCASVDLGALQQNYRAIAEYLEARRSGRQGGPGIIAVVKANAYGHGAVQVGLALEAVGARMLACADIEEGVELRRGGVRAPILVFGALGVSEVSGVFEYDLVPTISTPSAARALEHAAALRGRLLHCHLKIDTGMNRLGFRHDNIARTLPCVIDSPHLVIDAVYTHFATADDPDHTLFARQQVNFDRVLGRLVQMGLGTPKRHAANSSALLSDEQTWFDMVRPGLLLYGTLPILGHPLALSPVMGISSRLVAVKGVRVGEPVGYGARFRATRPTRLGVVPAGYADGLDGRLGGRGWVLIGGQRAPIVGAISMDMLTVDVTGLDVQPGEEVVLLGKQGNECITVSEMADLIGTIPYEILCRVGSRIERAYHGGKAERP